MSICVTLIRPYPHYVDMVCCCSAHRRWSGGLWFCSRILLDHGTQKADIRPVYSLDHIHTTWIYGLLFLLSPSPEAGGFACVSPKPWRAKGWHSVSILIRICYHQSPSKKFPFGHLFYSIFGDFIEVCCFIAIPVSTALHGSETNKWWMAAPR
jgi:hypothetical protein